MPRANRKRRGLATTEWAVIFAVILLFAFSIVSSLGTATRDDLDQTAEEVGDPTQLIHRFSTQEDD